MTAHSPCRIQRSIYEQIEIGVGTTQGRLHNVNLDGPTGFLFYGIGPGNEDALYDQVMHGHPIPHSNLYGFCRH